MKELTLKQFASLGGKASAKKLTKKQRIERARKASRCQKAYIDKIAKNKDINSLST